MCVCVIYICMNMYVYVYAYIYMYISVCLPYMYTHVYICICIYIYLYMCVFIDICKYCVFIDICKYVCMYTYTHTHKRTHTGAPACAVSNIKQAKVFQFGAKNAPRQNPSRKGTASRGWRWSSPPCRHGCMFFSPSSQFTDVSTVSRNMLTDPYDTLSLSLTHTHTYAHIHTHTLTHTHTRTASYDTMEWLRLVGSWKL